MMKIFNKYEIGIKKITGTTREPRTSRAGVIKTVKSGQETTASILGAYESEGDSIVPKREFIFDMDINVLRRFPTDVLLKNLQYLSPDVSMAIWTILRLCMSGWKLVVHDLAGKEYLAGYDYIWNEVIPNVNRDRGGFDSYLEMMHKTALVLGAVSSEVNLASDLRTVSDIIAVDPSTINFKKRKLTDGSVLYVPFQYLATGEKVIDKAGFYYVPVDADIGDPSGVSPIVSMLQIIFFQMQMMNDLQRVIHTQGYPKVDIKIVEEVIRKNAPRSYLSDPVKLVTFVDTQIKLIKQAYAKIDPDDAFIHTDAVDVSIVEANQQMGANARAILDTVDRQLANSIKILTIFINKHRGITETYGTVQWKIQVKTIESFQRIVKRVVDHALTFCLNQGGMQGNAMIEYEPIPTESPIQIEEALLMKTRRLTFARDAGYILHDTAAQLLFDQDGAESKEVPMFTDGGSNIEGEEALRKLLRQNQRDFSNTVGDAQTLNRDKLQDLQTSYNSDLSKLFRDFQKASGVDLIGGLK